MYKAQHEHIIIESYDSESLKEASEKCLKTLYYNIPAIGILIGIKDANNFSLSELRYPIKILTKLPQNCKTRLGIILDSSQKYQYNVKLLKPCILKKK